MDTIDKKYHKYVSTRKRGNTINSKTMLPPKDYINIISELKKTAILDGYKLLDLVNSKNREKPYVNDVYTGHRIATAESLTAGLIMSTLANIPIYGYLKYGSFVTYDTDAKRTFIGVKVDDVYTSQCAKEMAIGTLINSNATIAISVTGQAMTLKDDFLDLGHVHIGIAAYGIDDKILVSSSFMNACELNSSLNKLCKIWKYIYSQGQIVSSDYTALISEMIRYITTITAYNKCIEFIEKNDIVLPVGIFNFETRLLANIDGIYPKSKYFTDININSHIVDTTEVDVVNKMQQVENNKQYKKNKSEEYKHVQPPNIFNYPSKVRNQPTIPVRPRVPLKSRETRRITNTHTFMSSRTKHSQSKSAGKSKSRPIENAYPEILKGTSF